MQRTNRRGLSAILGVFLLLLCVHSAALAQVTEPGPLINLIIDAAAALNQARPSEPVGQAPVETQPTATPSSEDVVLYNGMVAERMADGGFILGDPDAPITIVSFEDFTCPHCQRYEPTVEGFIEQYVATGQARFEYRFFPIVDPTYAVLTTQIAECADDLRPGAFWEAHALLFQIGTATGFDNTTTRLVADELGLNYNDLLQCTTSADQYVTDYALGQSLGIQGTPGVMVRYGDGAPQFIEIDGTVYDRGGVPINVLAQVVTAGPQAPAIEPTLVPTLATAATPIKPETTDAQIFDTFVSAPGVDSNGCALNPTTTFPRSTAVVYIVTPASDVPAGTMLFARLSRDGVPIEDTDQLTAQQDYQDVCVWFAFDAETSAEVLQSGSYTAEVFVNGISAGTIAFTVGE
jgi:protein-disulfide isomerase